MWGGGRTGVAERAVRREEGVRSVPAVQRRSEQRAAESDAEGAEDDARRCLGVPAAACAWRWLRSTGSNRDHREAAGDGSSLHASR